MSDIQQFAGIITFVLVVIAMFSSVRHFRRHQRWAGFAILALAWSVAAFVLAQRIFVATWLSWMITTAIRERRMTTTKPATREALATR